MKNMRNAKFISIILLAALAWSCNQASKNDLMLSEKRMLASDEAVEPEIVSVRSAITSDNVTTPNIEPKVIKTANVSIEVSDYLKSRQKVDSIVQKHKGYITNESFQETESIRSNNITIRIPYQNFNALLCDVAAIAKKVDYQNIFTQDVTEEYIDIKTRLDNKLELERTYRKHLREAKNIEDILKIENKLAEIRSEIESAQGRLKYIDNQVNLSTVSLYVYQKLEYKYIPEALPSFWQRLKEGIHSGWKGFLWFIILIFKLWPLWLIGAVGYLAYIKTRGYLKSRKKKEKKEKKLKKKAWINPEIPE